MSNEGKIRLFPLLSLIEECEATIGFHRVGRGQFCLSLKLHRVQQVT